MLANPLAVSAYCFPTSIMGYNLWRYARERKTPPNALFIQVDDIKTPFDSYLLPFEFFGISISCYSRLKGVCFMSRPLRSSVVCDPRFLCACFLVAWSI